MKNKYYYLIILILFSIPIKIDAKNENKIYFNDNEIQVDNFYYNDRVFVDLSDFCKLTGYCKIENDGKQKKITQIIKVNETLSYKYEIYHELETKEYDSRIIVGNDSFQLKQDKIDVPSCPDTKEFKCSDTKSYVPIRFVSQALGLTVEWDNYNINIKNNLYDVFNKNFDIHLTHKIYFQDEIIEDDIVYNENQIYKIPKEYKAYTYVSNKENKVIPFIKEFAFFDKNVSKEEKNDGNFEINKDERSILTAVGKIGSKSTIAQIFMYTSDESSLSGVFPIIVPTNLEIIDEVKVHTQRYIYLSPSVQSENPYVCGNSTEMKRMNELSDIIEKNLKEKKWITVYNNKGSKSASESARMGKKYYDYLDLYLAIHSNGFKGTSRGIETLYHPKHSQQTHIYSDMIRKAVVDLHPTKKDRGKKPREDLAEVRPSIQKNLTFIEVGFHDHPEDCAWLIDDNNLNKIAKAISDVLINYWDEQEK